MANDVPTPVADAEKKLEDVTPSAIRPEVTAAVNEGNAEVRAAAAKSAEARRQAAQIDPALSQAATDAAAIAAGGTVPISALVGDVGRVRKEVKSGFKTTEFWLSAAVIVLSQLGTFSLPGHYGRTITTIAAAASYIVSRGIAKAG